jgi:tetratricopeptide (TPR) repeat protein
VNLRRTRVPAAVLAAVALAAWAAGDIAPDPLAEADRAAAAAEERLADAGRSGDAPPEPGPLRARRRAEAGERQYRLGDWENAAVLLADAVDEPGWSDAPARARALFQLADALRRAGRCGAARVRFAAYLALGAPDHRGAAVSGALDCAVKERRAGDVARLLVDAEQVFGAEPPAEVRYLAAKALFQRRDLPPPERIARAREAFAQVGSPFQLQAWYFQGVLAIEEGAPAASVPPFERCARSEPRDARDVELRDLCRLALGRVHADAGNLAAAIAWYRTTSPASPRLPEALHELAWTHVRAKDLEEALSMATFAAELAPESPLAPEATLLRGDLLLRLERWAGATAAFEDVIESYGPVRDELDALLSLKEDPVRYFHELVSRHQPRFEAASILPPVAARWATRDDDVALALGLVQEVGAARREVTEARAIVARIDALLARGGGIDAFPHLRSAFAAAQVAETAAARAEAAYVGALGAAVESALAPEGRAELLRARAARAALEPRFERLPSTPAAAAERLAVVRTRIDAADRETFRLGLAVEGAFAAIRGCEAWIEGHRVQLAPYPADRAGLADELRAHRSIAEGYEAELEALRRELAAARDAADGVQALGGGARVRAEYLEALEREWGALEAAGGRRVAPALFERADAARERLERVRARARTHAQAALAEATRRSAEVRAQLGADRAALAAQDAALDGIQASSKDLLGRIALRSLADVREQFHRLVLHADVGLVDVAWSRKRSRAERIQQLAVQKDAAVEQLDREYRAIAREVD